MNRNVLPLHTIVLGTLLLAMGNVALAQAPIETPESAADQVIPADAVHVDWINDIRAAQKLARQEGKDLILFVTGSDWCAFCIKMEEEFLADPATAERMSDRFVPVVVDFPKESQLPVLIAAQNEALREKLKVTGYPSVYFVDADLRPYAHLGGYHGAEAFWKSYAKISELSEKLAGIRQGRSVSAIDDPAQLDQLFQSVSRDMLELGWLDQVERLAEQDNTDNDPIRSAWSEKLVQIRQEILEREFMSELYQTYRMLVANKTPSEEIVAFFDEMEVRAGDQTKLLVHTIAIKAYYLAQNGQKDKALAQLEEASDLKDITAEQRKIVQELGQRIKAMPATKPQPADVQPASGLKTS